MPIKLPEFDWDPETFCACVRENSICINHKHFPVCFYSDSGAKASQGKEFVCEELLLSTLLAEVWVDIFLGHETSAKFAADTPSKIAF
ncbi:hypothetical protein VKT23_002711 [Stygiomarasmius scandens]|uniref:Uncharacterized protein n=1 Tax=Marasmiellus scandens TaxID=2682957 RepID=A0ABR1K6U2_9AGAR